LVKEHEATVQATPAGQLFVYFSLKLKTILKKGDTVLVHVVGNKVIIEKI